MKKAFTLAEVMIVLTVIGVLTAILLPVARQSMPDENLMKFKKAHNTLGTVIRELVTSDKYYLDGEFGKKPNGDWVVKNDYFLQTFADVLNTKNVVLPNGNDGAYNPDVVVSRDDIEGKAGLDYLCKTKQDDFSSYVLTSDNVYYYQVDDNISFGAQFDWFSTSGHNPFYTKWSGTVPYKDCIALTGADADNCVANNASDNVGFYFVYNAFCLDIDEINQGEDPFGYGIRIDGKILTGKRADEWLEREAMEE